MATSSYKTFLMHSTDEGSSYEKLIDIKDYPDLGGEPEMLETTTLSDAIQTNIPGIQSLDSMTFTANYDYTKYKELKAMEGKDKYFAVWMGGTGTGSSLQPDGSEGKYKFQGRLSVYVTGKGVNEVREMVISIGASTEIEVDEAV